MKEEIAVAVAFIIFPIVLYLLAVYILNLIRAPVYIKWEKEKIPSVVVKPNSGRRQWEYENPHLMWAELYITNTSPTLPLKNVEVQIATQLDIVDIREGGRGAPVKHHLYDRGTWSPVSVLWSGLDVSPPRTVIDISPGATKISLVAFQDDSNGIWTIYNAPISPKPRNLNGAKIKVVINSSNSALWEGEFYIECHGNYVIKDFPYRKNATFEFVEWDAWSNTHDVIQPSVPDKEGFQTE